MPFYTTSRSKTRTLILAYFVVFFNLKTFATVLWHSNDNIIIMFVARIICYVLYYNNAATARSVPIRNLSSGHTTHDLEICGHDVSAKTVRNCVWHRRKFARPGEKKKSKIKRCIPLQDNNAKRETYFENDYCAQTTVFFFFHPK